MGNGSINVNEAGDDPVQRSLEIACKNSNCNPEDRGNERTADARFEGYARAQNQAAELVASSRSGAQQILRRSPKPDRRASNDPTCSLELDCVAREAGPD